MTDVRTTISRLLATLDAVPLDVERDKDRLANVLHEVGGEFCHPFTELHPIAMHRSQAAAILSLVARLASPEPREDATPVTGPDTTLLSHVGVGSIRRCVNPLCDVPWSQPHKPDCGVGRFLAALATPATGPDE